ncbi:MAG: phosphoenolpyruvate synthase, partial [Candidatus Pacebacteria bacterium]|nr:phosphoenolpyruvate synthase [Candidatus Paceibacterota bacterium]
PVIVRFSDFKTNEYATLLGGEEFEPKEDNPMIGWRGASRYYHPNFRAAFDLECQAIKKVRDEMGLANTAVMIPFCRTVEEGKKVIKIMEENGLSRNKRDRNGLKIYVMCEIPSNVILAEQFLDIFDGMSIGSNDLTQLTIGIDRDSDKLLQGITDERDEAVKELIRQIIKTCKKREKYVGICGQAPSDYPEFAEFLMKEGIESMSLNPDSVMPTLMHLSKIKK